MRPNGEVEKAKKDRDDLLGEVQAAVDKVDRLTDDLLEQYAQAETERKRGLT